MARHSKAEQASGQLVYHSRNQFNYRKGTVVIDPKKKTLRYYAGMTNGQIGKNVSHKALKRMVIDAPLKGLKVYDNRKSGKRNNF